MFCYQQSTGEIVEVKEQEVWCIFLYDKDEDEGSIVNKAPLIFLDNKFGTAKENLEKFKNSRSGKLDFAEWKSNGRKIVIRAVKMIVPQ